MSDHADADPNRAEIEGWNAERGETWVRLNDQLDHQLEVLGLAAMEALSPRPGERVLDIGCGCGATTADLAARVAPGGAVLGVDVSEPMLAVARRRPTAGADASVAFEALDAQTGDLGRAAFDAAFSRFGVMFFADPVAAFRNIASSLRPDGRLAFVCWRTVQENPWLAMPYEVARHLLPERPPTDPHAPGPFAFADPERVRVILTQAGFIDVLIQPFDARVGGANLERTVDLSLYVGPLRAPLRERPELTESVAAVVREALRPFDTEGGVFMPAAVWIVTAARGS